ncbi:MAG: dTDP-4-dehydrorhamnose 3,5-epimerase [Bacteroidetes bacterium]|nr:dTDP-4-dehydrorhamnose 3,5-epimerase [Bacteroidota bacterium]
MKIVEEPLHGLLLIEPRVFHDPRGHFFESFNRIAMHNIGILDEFVQDNESLSSKGILRGLHFQRPPFAQGKLVRVAQGSVRDVVVDLRRSSSTFGQHFSVTLSGENHLMLWIPPGFAHGFLTLSDNTLFLYKCTAPYHQASEGGLAWDDPSLNIQWGIDQPLLSEKDKMNPVMAGFNTPFE